MTAQSCIFRDVLVVPPAGEQPFAGWVAVEAQPSQQWAEGPPSRMRISV